MRLLTIRARGHAELSRALLGRGFAAGAASEALERLEREGLLDDLAAARSVVRGRGARYGRARIERELKARGFARETIATALAAEGGVSREEDALRRAFRKLWKARSHLAPPLRRRKVLDALTRRGFPPEKIFEIIRGGYEVD